MNNFAPSIKHGLMAAIAAIIFYLVLYLIDINLVVGYASVLVWLAVIFLMIRGSIAQRTEDGGFITFGKAFTSSVVVGTIGSALFFVFTFFMYNTIDPDLKELAAEKSVEQTEKWLEKADLSYEEKQERLDAVYEQNANFTAKRLFIGIAIGLAISAIFSLAIGAMVKRKDHSVDFGG